MHGVAQGGQARVLIIHSENVYISAESKSPVSSWLTGGDAIQFEYANGYMQWILIAEDLSDVLNENEKEQNGRRGKD